MNEKEQYRLKFDNLKKLKKSETLPTGAKDNSS